MTDKKNYQASKRLVRRFYEATEQAGADLKTVFSEFVSADYHWRCICSSADYLKKTSDAIIVRYFL